MFQNVCDTPGCFILGGVLAYRQYPKMLLAAVNLGTFLVPQIIPPGAAFRLYN